eukprot:gene3420-8293_t
MAGRNSDAFARINFLYQWLLSTFDAVVKFILDRIFRDNPTYTTLLDTCSTDFEEESLANVSTAIEIKR